MSDSLLSVSLPLDASDDDIVDSSDCAANYRCLVHLQACLYVGDSNEYLMGTGVSR